MAIEKRKGKDGRKIYVHDDEKVLTGAIRCSAYVTYCRAPLLNENGEQVGVCNYNYGDDQDTLLCTQCGSKRKRCGLPALKETHMMDKPLCKKHLVKRSRYFSSMSRSLDEEATGIVLELMDNEYIDAIEVNMSMACHSVLQAIQTGSTGNKMLKVIERFYDVFKKYNDIKGRGDEALMELFTKLFIKQAGSYQQDAVIATTKAIYDIVDEISGEVEIRPEELKKEIHKRFALQAPEITKDYETRIRDKDLIEDVEIVEDE